MDDTHVEAARRERAELVKERERLAQRSAVVDERIGELDTFIRVAGTLSVSTRPRLVRPEPSGDVPAIGSVAKPATFKDQVIKLTEDMLAGTKWMKTKDIVTRLEQQGVVIRTNANKVVRISSILVKEKDRFSSNRKKGWTLKQGRIDAPKAKGLNAGTFSPSGNAIASHRGQPTLAAQPSD